MLDNLDPPDPQLQMRRSARNILSDYVQIRALNEQMVYGEYSIRRSQLPPHQNPNHRLVKVDSRDLKRLLSGAKEVYDGVVEFWGEETVPVLRSWLDEIGYIFLFVKDHLDPNDCFGLTDPNFKPKPALHLSVFQGLFHRDLKLRLTATTIIHECLHVRDHLLPPIDVESLLEPLRYYKKLGVLDDDTASALHQGKKEVLPWVVEGATVGNMHLPAKIWRVRYPKLVEWLLANRHHIFPT